MLRRLTGPLVLCLAVLSAGHTASAQMLINQADRPGQSNPPTLIPKGSVQVEGGIELERKTGGDDPDTDTLTFPDLLVRVGLTEWIELRLEAEGLLYEFREGASDRALGSDLTVATKIGTTEQRGLLPKAGLLLSLSLPVGSDAASSGGVDPSLDGLFLWKLGEETELVANTVFSAPTQGDDDDRRIFQFDPRISLERQLTTDIGTFVEYYGEIKSRGVADTHAMDAGFTWRLYGRRIQLDISGGGGLNEAAPDWFVGAGVSMRFSAPWAQ